MDIAKNGKFGYTIWSLSKTDVLCSGGINEEKGDFAGKEMNYRRMRRWHR